MLQVHGGYGYIAGHPIEQLYRDERVQRIYEGTNEINRLLIPGLLMTLSVVDYDRRHFTIEHGHTSIGYFSDDEDRLLLDRFWHALYLPIARAADALARLVGFIQQGRISVYLTYSFVTLLALLALVR